MTADVDMAGAAGLLHMSYSAFQRSWRALRHDATGQPFPLPFKGAHKGGRPWWRVAAIEAWKDGAAPAAAPASADTPGYPAQRADPSPPANDARPHPPSADVAALLAAAGG